MATRSKTEEARAKYDELRNKADEAITMSHKAEAESVEARDMVYNAQLEEEKADAKYAFLDSQAELAELIADHSERNVLFHELVDRWIARSTDLKCKKQLAKSEAYIECANELSALLDAADEPQ